MSTFLSSSCLNAAILLEGPKKKLLMIFSIGFINYCRSLCDRIIRCISIFLEAAPIEIANRKYGSWKHINFKNLLLKKSFYTWGGVSGNLKRPILD